MATCLSFKEKVKTRKDHKCFGCERIIPAGSVIEDSVCVEDGEIYHVRMCEVCKFIAAKFQKSGDEWYRGDLAEQPYWNEAKQEMEEKTRAKQQPLTTVRAATPASAGSAPTGERLRPY